VNYFGKFDATVSDALGQHPGAHVFSETVHASHAPSDAIVVPDAQLLFGGEFKRTGVDLVLSGDGREFVLHDYFKGEKHAPLASPDGAHLTGDLVNALAGQVQYAQAGGNAAAGQVIGHVTKLAGTATAIRNGVSIILNNGDNVEKGDVVASGSDSTVGITFIDGTVFGLSSNARMVLNEMVYDPNGSNNSSLLSLVAGTITFVAGETAKHGDMKVDTPVATMGIRGTAVLVEIDFSVPGTTPDAKFQVLVEPDGTTGSYILFDKTTLTPLAVVDKAGMQINVSNGVMSQTLAPLSPEIQKLITDVFSLKFSDSTNTKSIEHFTDSIVPNVFGQVNFALVNGNLSTFAALPPPPAGSGPAAPSAATIGHIAQAPNFFGDQIGKITETPHVTNSTGFDTATGQFQYFDINTTDHDTVSVKFSSFTYQNAKGQDVTGSLNSLQLADIAKVEAAITVSENTGPNGIGSGTANWTYNVADKAFDFLAAGETLTLTYTATVDNNYQPLDQTGTQTITITITGTNDAPMITSPQQNVSFVSAGTDTKGGELIPNTATQGTLNFADADLTDTHTVAVKMASALLNGQPLSNTVGQSVINELAAAVTASISSNGGHDSTLTGAGTIEWTLANLQVYLADLIPNGESLVLTYVVTVTDSATPPATSTQDIVVTIGGNQGAAVVWVNTTPIPEGGVALWSTASNWEGDRAPSTLGTDDVIIGTDQVLPGTPVFPATVNDAEAAKSLTMDYFTDFGSSIPELDILSTGSLTIVDALNMDTSTDSGSPLTAESIIKNFGTLSVGGIATLLKHSVLDNFGTITLAEGGVFGDQSSVTNSGTITFTEAGNFEDLSTVANSNTIIFDNGGNFVEQSVVSNTGSILNSVTNSGTIEVAGGTLDVAAGIDNSGGTLQVDNGAVLEITDGFIVNSDGSTSSIGTTISSGTLTIAGGGTLDIESSHGATLDGVQVIGTNKTNSVAASLIEVGATAAAILLLDDGTSIENGNLTISGGSAVDITTSGATLDGVNVTGANATLSVAASTIEVGTTTTTGTVLTLDDGTTITNGNLIVDSGNTLDIESSQGARLDGVNVTNSGTIQVDGAAAPATVTLVLDGGTTITDGTLLIHDPHSTAEGIVEIGAGGATFDDVTVTNNNLLKVDGGATLTLEGGTTISGGTIDDAGTLSVSASSEIENATVNGGGDLTVTSGTLTLSEVTLDDVTLAGSFTNSDKLTIDDTVTLNGATISGGTIDDLGTLLVTASSEIENATVNGGGDLTVTGGTLTLSKVTLDDVTLAGSFTNADKLTIDDTVTLNGATISGGTIDDLGTLLVTASSEIENATVNGGGDLTVTSGTLTLSKVTLDGVTLAGSFTNSDALTIDDTVTLNGATLNGGTIDDTGTLSVSASSEIENATVNGGGDLTVTGGTLTLSKVTLDGVTLAGSFTNADKLTIDDTVTLNGATLNGGTIDDTGTLSVSASSEIENATINGGGDLTVTGGTLTLSKVTLDGVTLAGSFANADKLTIDNTVTLNGATLNGGTIDDTGTLSVSASSEIENATVNGGGNITVVGGTLTLATVTLDGVTVSGTVTNAGTLTIDDTVTLNSAAITGGSIDVVGDLDTNGTSSISGASITNFGNIHIVSGTLAIDPTPFTNLGLFDVQSSVTFSEELFTNSGTVNNVPTNGTLQIDQNGTLTLESSSITGGIVSNSGAIDVTAVSSINNTFSFVNSGTVKADGAALTLSGATVTNTNGTFKTIGNGVLDLVNSTINKGTLSGKIATATGNTSSTLNGLTLAFGSLVTAAVGVLELTGTIFNNGEIDATAGAVDLDNATVNGGTFGGHGTIATASGNSDSVLSGVTIASGSTMTAAVGTLDLTGITTNNGEIDATTGTLHLHNADVTGGTLGGTGIIATDSLNVFSFLKNVTIATHTKIAASAGTLELTGTINDHGEIDATTGTIELINATIDGGTLGGDGTIVTASALNRLDGVTIASGTTVDVADGTALDLVGTITDAGTIALGASGHLTALEISGNVSLIGGGAVTMSSDFFSTIVSDGSAATLSNSDTISGSGVIGDSHLTLSNSGTIDATGSHALTIDTGANSFTSGGLVGNLQVTNNVGGVLEASAGHTLLIDDNVLNNGLIESGTPGAQSSAYVDVTGNISGTGSIEIFNNSTVEIGGSVTSGQTVTFGAPGGSVATNGLLILDDSHDFHGTISGLVENNNESLENQVDLRDLNYIPGLERLSVHASGSNGPGEKVTVTVSDFFGHPVDSVTLNLSGSSSGSFEVSSDGHGGVLLSDPPTSGDVAVDSNQTLEIGAASSATVNFTNSSGNTGELVLDDSKDFSGAINGFTGDGTTANSDLIDVTDVNIADVAMNKTTYTDHGNGTGTLTLYNASGQALDSINFDGNYQLANFTIENDGDGGTLIVDPPVNNNAQTPANTTVASNQNSTGSAGTDGFVFNFAGHNHPPTVDYHPDVETLPPGGSMLTNLHTGSNGAPDQGHSNMPLGADGQDHVGLSAFAKAHLHAADFHFV
jgi:FecR protein